MSKKIKGLFTDCHPKDQPPGTYRDAENAVINRKLGAVTNEKGTALLFELSLQGNSIIGQITVKDSIIIFSTGNTDQIGIFDGTDYTPIISNNALNFNTDNHISVEATRNDQEETLIIFTDDLNPIRLINLSKDYSAINATTIDSLNLLPKISSFPIVTPTVTSGGSLKTGAYQFFISFEYDDESESNKFQITNWISITDSISRDSKYDGSKGEVPTSKAIQLSLSNIDTAETIKYFYIYYVYRANNQIIESRRLERLAIATSKTVFVAGNKSDLEVSTEDILIDKAVYEKAKTITQVDDKFYFGNLTRRVDIGYQKYANNIKAKLVRKALPGVINQAYTDSYKDTNIRNNFVGYRRGDVYALYISFLLKNGQETLAYHIPGREAIYSRKVVSVDGIALDPTEYSQTDSYFYGETINYLDIGPAVAPNTVLSVTLTFAFTDHTGTEHPFTVNVSDGDTFDTVTTAIVTEFNTLGISSDFELITISNGTYNELGVKALNIGELYDGAFLACTINYATITADDGTNPTDTTRGGDDGIDETTDTITVNGTTFNVTYKTGDYATTVAEKLKNQIQANVSSVTVIQNFSKLIIESDDTPITFTVDASTKTTYNIGDTKGETQDIQSSETIYASSKQVYNGSSNTQEEPPRFYFDILQHQTLKTGFWQNEGETYPPNEDFEIWDVDGDGNGIATGSTLHNKQVRHHRIPDNIDEPIRIVDSTYALGFDFEDVKIPDELANDIIGVKIYRADRNGNKLVAGGGVGLKAIGIYNGSELDIAPEIMGLEQWGQDINTSATLQYEYANVGNILLNFDHHLLRTKENIGNLTHISAHSTSMQDYYEVEKTVLNNIDQRIWVKTNNPGIEYVEKDDITLNNMRSHIPGQGNPIIHKHTTNASMNNFNGLASDWNESTRTFDTIDPDLYKVLPISAKAYVEKDSTPIELGAFGFDIDMNNQDGKSAIVFEIDSGLYLKTRLHFNFLSFKKQVYTSFYNQLLVFTGKLDTNIDKFRNGGAQKIENVFGGDTYISNYYYMVSRIKFDDAWRVSMHHELCESYDNIEMRNQGEEPDQVYYPKSTADNVFKPTVDGLDYGEHDNYYGYSKEYGTLLTSKPAIPYNSFQPQTSKYPRRIIRTGGTSKNYRAFKEFDFSELYGDSGDITNLESLNNLLFIHTEDNLFRTYGKEELQVADIRAFVGTGDIFARKPQQMYQQDSGYAGILSPNHALVTKYGYVFVSSKDKAVYMLSDGLSELSSLGIREEIRDLIDAENDPSGSRGGFTSKIGYDPEYDRILFTIGNTTYSYLPQQKVWASKHSYAPSTYISHRNKFLSAKGKNIFQHHIGNPTTFYYTVHSFKIVFVENRQQNINAEAVNINYEHIIENSAGEYMLDETFDKFRIYNSYQDSGLTDIIYFKNGAGLPSGNARPEKNKWFINRFRDMLENGAINQALPWHKQARLRDTYFVVELQYNSNANSLYLFDTNVQMAR